MRTEPSAEQAAAWRTAEDLIANEAKVFVAFITESLSRYGVRRNTATGGSPHRSGPRTKFVEFISSNPDLDGWSEEFSFQVNAKHRYVPSQSYHDPDKPCLVRQIPFMRYGIRGKKRTYTVLAAATYKKILAEMQKLIETFIAESKAKHSSNEIRRQWRKLKETTMGALVVPPGMEVKLWIDQNNPPTEATTAEFSIQVKPGHSWGIHKAKLPIFFVREIVNLVNAVLQTEKLYVLASTREDGVHLFWDGSYWHRYNEQRGFGLIYRSQEAAQAELDRAKGLRCAWAKAKIVPWRNLFPHYTEIGAVPDYL